MTSWVMRLAAVGAGLAIMAAVTGNEPVTARQSESELSKRIAALEASQQAILKELKELKLLLQQPRPPVPTPAPSPSPGGPLAQAAPANTVKPVPPQLPTFDLDLAGSPSKGRADAKLILLEFSDFECPFCGRYARDTHDQVVKEFVDTGKVRYVFRHLPIEKLHPRALRASEASECALAQGKFWEYHKVLFSNQQLLNEPDFTRHAQLLGLNTPAFAQCMAAQLASPAKIRQDQNEGGRAGVTGTPTFFLGTLTKDGKLKAQRRLVGAHPIENFRTTIDALLAGAK